MQIPTTDIYIYMYILHVYIYIYMYNTYIYICYDIGKGERKDASLLSAEVQQEPNLDLANSA